MTLENEEQHLWVAHENPSSGSVINWLGDLEQIDLPLGVFLSKELLYIF